MQLAVEVVETGAGDLLHETRSRGEGGAVGGEQRLGAEGVTFGHCVGAGLVGLGLCLELVVGHGDPGVVGPVADRDACGRDRLLAEDGGTPAGGIAWDTGDDTSFAVSLAGWVAFQRGEEGA